MRAFNLLMALLLAACDVSFPNTEPVTGPPTASSPSPASTSNPVSATSTPTTANVSLVVWLPPQFLDTALGGEVLTAQIEQFQSASGESVRVRAKVERGPGGLLDSLLTTFEVAPRALPDVIALPRAALEAATRAGAVVPLEAWLPAEIQSDLYPFAQELSRVDGQWVGVPFAAEARVLAYRTDVYPSAPARWSEIVTGTLAAPLAEDLGLTVLSDYLARGGALSDEAGQPALSLDRLTQTLALLQSLEQAGFLPRATLNYTNTTTTWQVFRERRTTAALTSAQWFLREASRVENSAAALPPTANGAAYTLAESWSWALVNKSNDLTQAAQLLTWLTAPEQMAAWTQAARVLPTRLTALAGWGDDPLAPLATAVLTNAWPSPSESALAVLGPLLRRAADDVLNARLTPSEAARVVVQAWGAANP